MYSLWSPNSQDVKSLKWPILLSDTPVAVAPESDPRKSLENVPNLCQNVFIVITQFPKAWNYFLSDTPAAVAPESDPAAGFLAAEQVMYI